VDAGRQATLQFDEQLKELARGISRQLPPEETVRIAVFPITDMEGSETECGRLLSRYLETELVRQGRELGTFSLVERDNLPIIMEEVKHSLSGMADESHCIQAGKQLGATSLLRAAMNPWGEGKVRIIGKVMDVESTQILAAFSSDVSLPGHARSLCVQPPEPSSAKPELIIAENPDSEYRIRVWTDKAVYRLGDPVQIFVQANRDGYLYLYDIDSQGNQTLLLPNIYARRPHFLAGGDLFESPKGWFTAGRPTGRGTIKAVMTPDPLPMQDPTFSDLSHSVPFRSVDRANTRGVVIDTRRTRGGFGTGWVTIEE